MSAAARARSPNSRKPGSFVTVVIPELFRRRSLASALRRKTFPLKLRLYWLRAPAYRLPLLVLDATGMRVGELEQLTWGDVDEQRGRWRVSRTVAKTGNEGRWVNVPPVLLALVLELCPRDDRHPLRRVFEGITADRLRTISRDV